MCLPFACMPLLAAASSSPPNDLTGLVGFADASACEPNKTFADFLSSLMTFHRGRFGIGHVKAATRFQPFLGTPILKARPSEGLNAHEVVMPVSGKWQGLHITHVASYLAPEGHYGFTIRFRDSAAAVRKQLNTLGFALPASGAREIDDPPSGIAVMGDAVEAKLDCYF